MYALAPMTERVRKMRARYRDTAPEICIARYRLITEFYMQHPELTGIMKRAENFRYICENIPVRIDEGEVIVGAQSGKYRACALYPENSFEQLLEEVRSGLISDRKVDPYIVSEEDRAYILKTGGFWLKECMSAKADACALDGYFAHSGSGTTMFGVRGQGFAPVGHFCAGYDTAIRRGFAAIKEEADDRAAQLEEDGVYGDGAERYHFYRAVSVVSEGMITLTKRYAALAVRKAADEKEPNRKRELLEMAGTLGWCMEKPCRNFREALQCLYMYQTCLCLDANMHGITFGRVDQYLGDFYENDLRAGRITPEYAQELMDLFYLKVAEMNKFYPDVGGKSVGGYTSGQLMTLGGVKKDGGDATNAVTYMMLQASGRLLLHDPPQSLRIHKGTPPELWEAAVETTKMAGGVPTFENDDLIIPALTDRGLGLESARNYCLIGCVEPAGTGDDWPACGGTGSQSFWNLAGALWLAINNGINPMPVAFGGEKLTAGHQAGLPTGYLYEMETFEEVLDAFKKQVEYFVKWHISCTNNFEYVARDVLPQPVVSATMDGCMEKGADVMYGGARYNSTGVAGVGIGNVGDSLQMIRHLVFDEKICTARELYDALLHNWRGHEELRRYIKNSAPHYGNGIREADRYAGWAAGVFADAVNAGTGPRGRYSAGLYPVAMNIAFGAMTAATPDGRSSGDPLADGISPVQQMDSNGPTGVLLSVSQIDQSKFPNGTLLNMKFHPTALRGEDGVKKLTDLIRTYFEMGGMEVQVNVISAETMRDAQRHPEEYRNLIVRVAGFSVYFVELYVEAQNDLISRTELAM
jgi:pyruvate formate-lyase/glycerol dehydratase family glycyl radical enzyme